MKRIGLGWALAVGMWLAVGWMINAWAAEAVEQDGVKVTKVEAAGAAAAPVDADAAAKNRLRDWTETLGGIVLALRLILKVAPTPAPGSVYYVIWELLRHASLNITPSDGNAGGGNVGTNIGSKVAVVGLGLGLLCSQGCAIQRTCSFEPETKKLQTFTQIVWFQKANVEGLKAHWTSKTGSSALSVSKENAETQTEALSAVISAAVAGAVKGAK